MVKESSAPCVSAISRRGSIDELNSTHNSAAPDRIIPITLAAANAFVAQHHRHHPPVVGHKFSIGFADGTSLRGVVIVGRPVARHLDNGQTLEVTRCCTDGVPNGCSRLYGAAWRAAKALGFTRLITYTLEEESGVSLKASGWRLVGKRGGGRWTRPRRLRVDNHPTQTKFLWEAV
jgi:hypothetical protein